MCRVTGVLNLITDTVYHVLLHRIADIKEGRENMKILITGAGGLIGSYTIENLHSNGYKVFGLYRERPAVNKRWDIIESDLLQDESIKIIKSIEPDLIVHCAAILPQTHGNKTASEAARLNDVIDNRIIHFCIHNEKCRLVYMSGTSIYSLKNYPCNEESEVIPIGPYLQAKYKTEKLIRALKNNHIILRISAPYGPGQKSNTVLKIFIENAISNKDIFYFGSGNRTQDFTHAIDIAHAIANVVLNKSASGVLNLSGGNPVTMKSLASLVIKSIPGTTSRVYGSNKSDPQEQYRANIDISKAKKVLNWDPEILLPQGIRDWAVLEMIKTNL